jgi:hypothetical protein
LLRSSTAFSSSIGKKNPSSSSSSSSLLFLFLNINHK